MYSCIKKNAILGFIYLAIKPNNCKCTNKGPV